MLPQTDELWRENLRTDNPVILAGTGIIDGTTFIDPILLNYDLALTELTQKMTTLPSGRRVVMIGCKALFESNAELDVMMTHLADVVKVPGIAATMLAEDLQRAWNEKGSAANMFFMSPLESDPTLATLQDRGLIWHVGPKFNIIARVYAPLLTRTLAHLAVTGTVKVATVVTTDSRLLSTMVTTIEATPQQYGLSFNDKAVAENRTDGNYLGIGISSNFEDTIASQVADLVEFEPTVIISAADTRFLQEVIPAIENAWPESGSPKPFYLLSPGNYNDDTALQALVESNSSLASRMAGVNPAAAADSTAYERYIGRWDIAFPDYRDVRGMENFYDAAYYLIYAAVGAGQNLTNGTNLVTGMNRLLSGAGPYQVGPDDMPTAMATLAAVGSATIQLNGTLGPPDFNPADGTRESPGSVWCFDPSTGTCQADVLRYVPDADPTRATLSGTLPCIPGF